MCARVMKKHVLWLASLQHPDKWDVSIMDWWIVQPSDPYNECWNSSLVVENNLLYP